MKTRGAGSHDRGLRGTKGTITVDPQKLQAYNRSVAKVRSAIQRNNRDVGGRVVRGYSFFGYHGTGDHQAVDSSQVTSLQAIEQRLAALGACKGRWHAGKSG